MVDISGGSELKGEVVAVTGAGTPFGAAVCEFLALAGAVVVCLDLEERAENLENRARELRERGGDLVVYRLPARAEEEGLHQVFRKLAREMGAPYGLCNALGKGRLSYSIEQDLEEWREVFEQNVHLPFAAIKAALPYLLGRGGSVVNVCAEAAVSNPPYLAAYSAAKAAVLAMTRSMAEEFKMRGVRFNVVAPSGVEGSAVPPGGYPAGAGDLTAVSASLTAVEPEEVARTVAFLLSPHARSITGQVIILR